MKDYNSRSRFRALLELASMPLAAMFVLPLHIGHGDQALDQHLPRFLMRILSRYEHLLMRSIDFLASRDFIYDHDFSRRLVMGLAEVIMNNINGEILTLAEGLEMVDSVAVAGYAVAVGTCPCRRARNEISDVLPNNTDMVFGQWAEEYLENYPGLYHRVSREEARALVEDFDRHGFLHQVYGFARKKGAAFVLCNCDPEVCIPLQAQKSRGFQSFRKGRSLAVVDPGACAGLAECGVCLARCPFDARVSTGTTGEVHAELCFGCGLCVATCRGGATTLQRKKGARLIHAGKLVS
jgi:ferredoxin